MKKTTKQKKKLEFTVKLSKWICGGSSVEANGLGEGQTALLNKEGYKCCLGFACGQLGFKGRLLEEAEPDDLGRIIPGLTKRGDDCVINTAFSDKAIIINDDTHTTVEEKQKRLISLGKKHKIKINFIK